MNHTLRIYHFLSGLFEFYNDRLFESKLPECVITLNKISNASGIFYRNHWRNKEGNILHEIAITPESNFYSVEFHQALVHEMCHFWQIEFGKKISREGYHNKEFMEIMINIGLMPSDTGKPGGKMIGQHLSDFPIKNGRFINAFNEFNKEKTQLDILICDSVSHEIVTPKSHNSGKRLKYTCNCGTNIWGKPELKNIYCEQCKTNFLPNVAEQR